MFGKAMVINKTRSQYLNNTFKRHNEDIQNGCDGEYSPTNQEDQVASPV